MDTESAVTNSAPPPSQGQATLFQEIDAFPWDAEKDFQDGLQHILPAAKDPSHAEHLTLRARCFYYCRKQSIPPIDHKAYIAWRSQRQNHPPSTSPSPTSQTLPSEPISGPSFNPAIPSASAPPQPATAEDPAPYPITFSEIVELISSGQPIPGIKEIPDTVLEGQKSETVRSRRKKPWEKDETAVKVDDVGQGLELGK